MIEIVIKIPEGLKDVFENRTVTALDVEEMRMAIKNGTPLPKGHGRLIDVNELLDDINLEDNDYNRDVNTGEIITLENIDRISTIIEADKESEEE